MVSKGQRPSGVMKMIHFIGAGPGDPELITVKGRRLIDEADVIIYAGSLVNPKVLDGHKDSAVIYNSALMDLDEVSRIEIEAAKKGLSVARVHTGDPSIYGAIREQMDLLEKEGIEFDVIPGVSSFVATAAVLKKEYTLPDVSQTVILTRMEGRTPMPPKEKLIDLARHNSSMVIFLSVSFMDELCKTLIEGGYSPDTPVAVVYKATWPEEEAYVCTVQELPRVAEEHHITKTALVLVGDVIAHRKYAKSRLYAPDFETEFRKAKS